MFTAKCGYQVLASTMSYSALQSTSDNNSHLLVVFAGIAAISLLVLVLIVIGVLLTIAVLGLKARTAATTTLAEVKGKVYPIIDKTNGLVGQLSPTIQSITEKTNALITDLSPRISGITENVQGISGHLEHMSAVAKQKVEEFSPTLSAVNQTALNANQTVQDANQKTHQQVERVNGMITSILDKGVQLSEQLARVSQMPIKRMAEFARVAKGRLDVALSRLRPQRRSV